MGRLRWLQDHRTGNPGCLFQTNKYFYIRDAGIYLRSSADGVLDIVSDTTLKLTAPTITFTGSTALTLTGDITLTGHLTMADAKNIIVNATTGTKIGTAVTQKLGFFGVAPVVQPAAAAQAAAPAGGAGATAGAYDTVENRDAAIATINAIRTALVNVGIIKGAA